MPAKDRCYTAGPHNQPSVADIQCAAAVIRRGKKEEERKKIETTGKNIMACPVSHGGQKVTETEFRSMLRWGLKDMLTFLSSYYKLHSLAYNKHILQILSGFHKQ